MVSYFLVFGISRRQDNRSLKDQNDELNGQIINLSIQGAKNLMTASFSDSLAAEINSVSRSEVDLKNITNSSVLLYSKIGFLISVVCVSS